MTRTRKGFTIVELLVAITILTVGLLAYLGSSALDSRSLLRERNIDLAAIFAMRRLEQLRVDACRRHLDSAEVLMRGADTLATNTWRFTLAPGGQGYRVSLVSWYMKAPINVSGTAAARRAATHRSDTYETGISCAL
jgi:prepilin-type N-terminal cleavage/methylation domain-containing protein